MDDSITPSEAWKFAPAPVPLGRPTPAMKSRYRGRLPSILRPISFIMSTVSWRPRACCGGGRTRRDDHPAVEPSALAVPLSVHQYNASVEVVAHPLGMNDHGNGVMPLVMPVAMLDERKVSYCSDRVALQVDIEELGDVSMRNGVRIEVEDAPIDKTGKQEHPKAGLRRWAT